MQKVAQGPHPPQTPCQDASAAGSNIPAATHGGPESSSDKSTCSRNTPPPQLVDQEEQSQPLPVPLLEVGPICAAARDAFGEGVDGDFFQDAAAAFAEMLQGVAAEDDGMGVAEEEEDDHNEDNEDNDGCDDRGAFFVDGFEDLPEICCSSAAEEGPGAAMEEDDGSQFFADAANAVAEMIEDAAAVSFADDLEDVLGGGEGSRGGAPSSAGEEPRCPSPVYHDCAPEEHHQQPGPPATSSVPESETVSDALAGPPPASEGIDGVEPAFLDCLTDIFPDSETDEPDMRGGPADAPPVDAPTVPLSPPVRSHPACESPKCTTASPSPSFHECEDVGRERSPEDTSKDTTSPSPSFHDCEAEVAKGSTSTHRDCLPASAAPAASEGASLRAKPGEDPDPEGWDDEEHYEDEDDEYYEEEEEEEAEQSGFRWISEAELLAR